MNRSDGAMVNLKKIWLGRQPRERLMLSAGMALLVLVIAYLVLWQPAARGIRQLQTELPMLRTQNATMQLMAQEVSRLRGGSNASASLPPAERLNAVRQSLERAGLKSAAVELAGENRVRIRIDDVDYGSWANWLANAEGELGTRAASAIITTLNTTAGTGHVRVELLLDFAKSGAGQ